MDQAQGESIPFQPALCNAWSLACLPISFKIAHIVAQPPVNGATGAAAERLKRAESTFTKSVQFINKTIISIGKVDRKIAVINNKLFV